MEYFICHIYIDEIASIVNGRSLRATFFARNGEKNVGKWLCVFLGIGYNWVSTVRLCVQLG
jgi:hypothetical protein